MNKFNYLHELAQNVIIPETLVLKKKPVGDDGEMIFVVDSDIAGSGGSNETFRNKDKIKGTGLFYFDKGDLRKWVSKKYSAEEFAKNIPIFKNAINDINKGEKTFDELIDDLEEVVDLGMADKISTFLEDLKEKLKTDINSPEVKAFNDFRKKFRRYSLNNQILIFVQRPNSTHVAGKMKWVKEFNRKLKLGAKGIYIYVPTGTGIKKDEETPPQEDGYNPNIRFMLRPVYDIADTEVIEGMEDKAIIPEEPKWFDDTAVDEKNEIIYNGLLDYAKTHNIEVTVDEKGLDGARGVSKIDSIQLLQENIGTLIHELAHEILHDKAIRTNKTAKTKQILELQAEGVAYVVLREFNMPTEHASKYMAIWKIAPDEIQENEAEIRKAATLLIDHIYAYGNSLGDKPAQPVQSEGFKSFFRSKLLLH